MTATDLDTGLEPYLRHVDGDPLTAEQERELGWRIIRQNDPQARERIIRCNLRLVIYLAKRLMNRGVSLADLVAEGNVGLLRAVESFDPDRGTRFSTYATWWIRQAMKRALIRSQPLHVSDFMAGRIVKWKRVNRQLQERLGREPSITEVSEWMRLPVEKVRAIRDAALTLRKPAYTSAGHGECSLALAELLHDRRTPAPDERVGHAENLQAMRELLERIDPREAMVLRLRFGLDKPPMTLKEIGVQLGVTRERVRQLQIKALRTLKKRLTSDRPLSGPPMHVAGARSPRPLRPDDRAGRPAVDDDMENMGPQSRNPLAFPDRRPMVNESAERESTNNRLRVG